MPKLLIKRADPKWSEFTDVLDRRLSAHPDEIVASRCKGDLTYSERILRNRDDIEAEGTLEYIRAEIGDCDCDVLDIAR